MKKGMRTPSIKKSVRAKTTGKINRSIKRSIDPTYGKKGMGMIKDPKKAVYNKVYNKTTFSVKDIYKASRSNNSASTSDTFHSESNFENASVPNLHNEKVSNDSYIISDGKAIFGKKSYSEKQLKRYSISLMIVGVFLIVCGLLVLPIGLIFSLFGIITVCVSRSYAKARKELSK